jgi:hypothetical protein
MLKILLYGLLIWFLYNLVFRFIIPVYRTSKQMKQKFREMHEQMQNQATAAGQQQQPQQKGSPIPKSSAASKPTGDYIDFEEVK